MASASSSTSSRKHSDGGAAACAVLSHVALLSLITTFQRGLPGVVAPLVHRYEADGWMQRTTRAVWVWDPETAAHTKQSVACVTSQVSGRIWPPRQWHMRCALEASAAYDNREAGFPVLRRLLDACSDMMRGQPRKARARAFENSHHRVWDAAAAFGRVDVLQWMHAAYGRVRSVQALLRSCASKALRHGQLPVLNWIERTFGAKTLLRVMLSPGKRFVNASDAVSRGRVNVIHWLHERKMCLVVDGSALRKAVEGGDVAMLRALNSGTETLVAQTNDALVAYAVASGQAEVLSFLVGACGIRATVRTLERALALGHDAVATRLVEHRDALQRDECGLHGPLPLHLRQRIQSHGLVGETVTHRVVRMLLPQYPTEAIAAALVKYALREHLNKSSFIWQLADDTLSQLVGSELPMTVIAFAQRVRSDLLGPLTTAVLRCRWIREPNAAFSFQDEVMRELPAATKEDTLDAVLSLLFIASPWDIQLILEGDATRQPKPHCDAAFLALCAALCQHDTYLRVTRSFFEVRVRSMRSSIPS